MKTTNNDSKLTTWTVDPVHSSVAFSVRHLMVTNVRGEFQQVGGTVRYSPDWPEATEIEADIATASVHTHAPQRDAHLRSADFFDAEMYPTMAFRSTGARLAGPGALAVSGDLTLRGVTRPVTLAVVDITAEQRDHNGAIRIGASATGRIKRSDFGITYNKALEAGGIAIGDEVSLVLDVSLVKNAPR
jgi:polyisoprenoid-binding protein YceI